MKELEDVINEIEELEEEEVSFLRLIGQIEGAMEQSNKIKDNSGRYKSRLDKAVNDIEHFAESTERPRSCDSNKYFKMIGVLLRNRRKVKQMDERAYIFLKYANKFKGFLANMKNELVLAKKHNNKYHTKVLLEEFGEIIE